MGRRRENKERSDNGYQNVESENSITGCLYFIVMYFILSTELEEKSR